MSQAPCRSETVMDSRWMYVYMVLMSGLVHLPGVQSETPMQPPTQGCGGAVVANANHGFISSPGYPRNYPPSSDCRWTLTGGATVQVNVQELVTEDSGCSYDYVILKSADGTAYPRLCGEIKKKKYSLITPATIEFVSDGYQQKKGFLIEFYTEDNSTSETCGFTMTGDVGAFFSPGFPGMYPPDARCEWVIDGPPGGVVSLTFISLDVEEDPFCRLDKVTVYPGGNNTIPTVLCGKKRMSVVTSTSNTMLVVFTSDDRGQFPGFEANFETSRPGPPSGPDYPTGTGSGGGDSSSGMGEVGCESQVLRGSAGSLNSPGYYGPYPTGLNCTWTILAPPGQNIILSVVTLDLAPAGTGGSCPLAGVTVSDNSRLITTFCGTLLVGSKRELLSKTNQLTVNFYSVEAGNDHTGFLLHYSFTFPPPPGMPAGPGTGGSGFGPPTGSGMGELGTGIGIGTGVFRCNNSVIIPSVDTCNGVNNCGDNSDESTRAGCAGTFTCRDGDVIRGYEKCNGFRDCKDGSDEDSSYAQCTDIYLCKNGGVIPRSYLCDGYQDCSDGSDEGVEGSCVGSLCLADSCLNNATCTTHDVNGASSLMCACPPQWSGPRCETDIEDNCRTKPCLNGGTCYDQPQAFLCACVVGFLGNQCETAVGVSEVFNVRVSNAEGTNNKTCGNTDNPCQSVEYAIARSKAGTVITLTAKRNQTANYTIRGMLISRSLTLSGPDSNTVQLQFENTILAGSSGNSVSVTITQLDLTGEMYLGDAILLVRDSNVNKMTFQQDYQRRSPTGSIEYSFLDTIVRNSKLLSQNWQLAQSQDNVNYELYSAKLTIGQCSLFNTVINITASPADVRLGGVGLAGSRGVHVNAGIPPSSKKESSTGASTATTTTVSIKTCVFQNSQDLGNMTAAAAVFVVLKYGKFFVDVADSTFQNQARAIHVQIVGSKEGTMRINNCRFLRNKASGPGGAIFYEQETGDVTTKIKSCVFNNNVAQAFKLVGSDFSINQVSKITGSGGAIAIAVQPAPMQTGVVRNYAVIKECTFRNNTAENYGGSLYFSGGVSATVERCNLTNVEHGKLRPAVGDILESRGNLLLRSTRLAVQSAIGKIAILSYRADKDGSFMESTDLEIYCPQGYQTNEIFNAVKISTNTTRSPIESLLLYCSPCRKGSYTLGRSHATITGINVLHNTINTCNSCPYGATCDARVNAKSNFWGVPEADGRVLMYSCPDGYCCPSQTCSSFDICSENREGPLCGTCKSGYSESLFTTDCLPNPTCSYLDAVWIIIGLYGLAYVLFFFFQDEIMLVVGNFAHWIKKHLKRCGCLPSKDEVPPEENGDHGEDSDASDAFLSIFLYFIQAADLMKVNVLYSSDHSNPIQNFQDSILKIFSFSTFGINSDVCLFEDLSAVMKFLAKTAFIVYLFVIWAILFIFAGIIRCCFKSAGQKVKWIVPITMKAKFLGVLVNLMLYTYQYFAENSFAVLKCVKVGMGITPVLYIDGTVTCFQTWQYGVIAFAVVFVFPFFMVLMLGPALLKHRRIGVFTFLVAILLPLLGTPILLYKWFKWKRSTKKATDNNFNNNSSTDEEEKLIGSVDTISEILTSAYRDDFGGGLCWEGIIVMRRLILVLMATLITNVLYKQSAILILGFVSLGTHLFSVPFSAPINNGLETLSLCTLLFITVGNLVKAVYVEAGNVPVGNADELLAVYDWIEIVLLSIIPMVLMGIVALAITIRVIAFLVKQCRLLCGGCGSSTQLEEGFDVLPPHLRTSRRKPRKNLSSVQKNWNGKHRLRFTNSVVDRNENGNSELHRNWEELSSYDPGTGPRPRRTGDRSPASTGRYVKNEAFTAPSTAGGDTDWRGAHTGGIHTRSTYGQIGNFYHPFPSGTMNSLEFGDSTTTRGYDS